MDVTVGMMYDAFQDAYEQMQPVIVLYGERIPMELVNRLLRHLETHVAPITEEKGIDFEEMHLDTRDIPVCLCAVSIADEDVDMATKDFGNARYSDLKAAYTKAVENGSEEFSVGTVEFYTNYAKYLIEYLDGRGIPDDVFMRDIVRPHTED